MLKLCGLQESEIENPQSGGDLELELDDDSDKVSQICRELYKSGIHIDQTTMALQTDEDRIKTI